MKKVAIVGFGAAGFCCFKSIVENQGSLSLSVHIYNESTELSVGLAYQKDEDFICLNYHHQFINADSVDQHHFSNWLRTKRPHYLTKYSNYQPRWVFGEYMQSQFQALSKVLNGDLFVHQSTVTNVVIHSHEYWLQTDDSFSQFDAVILATGHPSGKKPKFKNPFGHYIHNPYPLRYLPKLPPHSTVGIVGMGLTGIDCAITLRERKHQGSILMVSRSGRLSYKRTTPSHHECKYFTKQRVNEMNLKGQGSLSNYIKILNLELIEGSGFSMNDILSANGKISEDHMVWQNVLYSCDEALSAAWINLSLREKKIFYGRFFVPWLRERVGIAPNNYKKILEMKSSGAIELLGNLRKIHLGSGFLEFSHSTRKADYVINCTGSPRHLDDQEKSLLHSLVKSGICTRDEFGGIKVDPANNEVLGSGSKRRLMMYALGHQTSGTFLYTPLMNHLTARGDIIAKNLVEKLNEMSCARKYFLATQD